MLKALFGSACSSSIDRTLANKFSAKVRHEASSYRRFSYLRFAFLSIWRMLYRYAIEFQRRFIAKFRFGRRGIPKGGFVVAFVGTDGSGKSSAVARTEKFYKIQMNTAHHFQGNGRSGAGLLRKVIFKILGSAARFKAHRKYRVSNVSGSVDTKCPWYYSLWVYIAVKDKTKFLRRIVADSANGRLVLVDRWPQSQILGRLDGPRLTNESKSFLQRFAFDFEQNYYQFASSFSPNLIIHLKVSPQVASERKPGEFSIDHSKADLIAISEIKWPPETKFVEIDANRSIEDVDLAIRNSIWACIGAHDI